MSICSSGLSSPGPLQPVTTVVAPTHPLIQLAQVIPWQALDQLVLPDLQHTTANDTITNAWVIDLEDLTQ
jgi:hypothetical protein